MKDRRGRPKACKAQRIRAEGGQAAFNSDSVTDYNAVARMIEQAKDTFGGLHAIVNPAGILRDTMFHKMTEEDWDRVINVHLRGSFNVTRVDRAVPRAEGWAPMCSSPRPPA